MFCPCGLFSQKGLHSAGAGPKLLKWGLSGRGSNLLKSGRPPYSYTVTPRTPGLRKPPHDTLHTTSPDESELSCVTVAQHDERKSDIRKNTANVNQRATWNGYTPTRNDATADGRERHRDPDAKPQKPNRCARE